MKTNLQFIAVFTIAALSASSPRGVELDSTHINFSAGIGLEVVQFVHSSYGRSLTPTDTSWLNNYWLQSISTAMRVDARITERLTGRIEYAGSVNFSFAGENDLSHIQVRTGYGILRSAYAQYAFGSSSRLAALLRLGAFPYGYAPENRNLGGYMFKTGIYPGYIISGDEDWRVLGALLSADFPAWLHHDVLATLEMDQGPLGDVTLTYIGRFNNGHALECDAGFMLGRILRSGQAQAAQINSFGRYPVIQNGDTTGWYQKAGVKLMTRMVFDIKRLIQMPRLGSRDLILYAEGAVLGVKDYPGYYDNIIERIPVMVGVSLPAFKLLDVIAVEAEYYGSPWKNNIGYTRPIPDESYEWEINSNAGMDVVTGYHIIENPAEGAGSKGKTDNFKWSIQAEKTVSRFSFIARAASDHFVHCREGGVAATEKLLSPAEWYWLFRLATAF